MRQRKHFSGAGGFFLLFLLLLIAFPGAARDREQMKEDLPSSSEGQCPAEKVFVQAAGDVREPGVYGFDHAPRLKELIERAGGPVPPGLADIPDGDTPLKPGGRVVITSTLSHLAFVSGKMSPFQRLTLGIPISINTDTALDLTAVPGIGPKTAGAIVYARERTGRFKQLKELLSIRGISASLYDRIRPYLTL